MAGLRRFIAASGMTNLADGIAVAAWGWSAPLRMRGLLPVALLPVALRLAPNAWAPTLCFAATEFAGFVWNIVSVSTRQRLVPDGLRGRVNSLYRLLAWGMMPLGLVLSGLIVTLGEHLVPRDLALTLPFWVAGLGSAVLALAVWRAIPRGFAAM